MKILVLITACLVLPLSLWAMKPVSDAELAGVTGGAGVSINPDVTMNIRIDTLAWGDADGINPACGVNPWPGEGQTSGGYFGVTGFEATGIRIRLRTDTINGFNPSMVKPMTIDVATGYAPYGVDTTFVRIAPGSLMISMDEMHFDVALGPRTTGAPALNQVLGRASVGAMAAYVNPRSYVDVSAGAKGSGVTFGLNVVLDGITIPYVSWGNPR